ncbi:MAG: PDZ domain-containing protein [Geobacter sp.]|nr:MAG: PDZ domain-containing protein [Geobacter sp.]
MAFVDKMLLVVLGVASLALSGCASNSQTFMGPKGEIKNCASTSQGQGLGGVLMANSRFNACVDEIKALGFKEIEAIGTVGISTSSIEGNGLRVIKVYDNSPAAKAGIIKNDIIVAINGSKPIRDTDFAATHGNIGSPVDLTISRDGKLSNHTLVRSQCAYSRLLETVTY